MAMNLLSRTAPPAGPGPQAARGAQRFVVHKCGVQNRPAGWHSRWHVCRMTGARAPSVRAAFQSTTTTSTRSLQRSPPWETQLPARFAPLEEDSTADVCVVGGGLAGLTTAYLLGQAGKSVVLLEARTLGSGNSGCSSGALSLWNDAYYKEVMGMAGAERTRMVADAHAAALDFVQGTVKREGINCDLRQVPTYVFPHLERGDWPSPQGLTKLRKEMEACHKLGVTTELVNLSSPDAGAGSKAAGGDSGQLPEGVKEALAFPDGLSVHPQQFLDGLAQAVVRQGGVIHEGTRAVGGALTGPSKGIVKTLNGASVTAREGVVLATHSPINRDQVWVHNRQLPRRYYHIALEVPAGSARSAQYYDTASAPHDVRVLRGTDRDSDLLLVRGEAHHHGEHSSKVGDPWGRLEAWARQHWPQAGRVTSVWSSMDYVPADLLGLYGQDPMDFSKPPNYILTGHGGQEWTRAIIGAHVVAGQITGKPVPWGEVFNPGRAFANATLRYGSELAVYFSTVGWSLVKHLIPRSLEDAKGWLSPKAVEERLQPGQGVVAQHGWRKKALYLEEDGKTLHMRSALCTHLGCCVEWNALSKTFDCPCHGSEFDTYGGCVHAPAVADLEDLGTKTLPPRQQQQSQS